MFQGKCKCGEMSLVSKRYLRSWSKQKCVKCNSSLIVKTDTDNKMKRNKIQKKKVSGGARKKVRNMRRSVPDRKYVKICPKFTCSSTINETYLEKPFEMMKVSCPSVVLNDMRTDIDLTYELLMLILDNENKKFGMKCDDIVMNDVFWDM